LAVIVEVNPNAATPGPITFANANGSATSTVAIDAPVGTDEFVFTVWDKKQQQGETQPVGNLLGQADVPAQTIVADKTNTINAIIGGTTQSVKIAPLAGQPFVSTDTAGGYDIAGDTPATFAATAYDVDGNIIVGPGAPKLGFAASPASGSELTVARVAGQPNQFTVTAAGATTSAGPAGVVVTATDAGAPSTTAANLSVWVRSAVYVSYAVGAGSKIAVYDDRGHTIALPATAFAGLSSPAGVAYSPKEHRLFVADNKLNKVFAFDAAGGAVAGFTAPSLPGARGVAYDPQSDAVYATGTNETIAFKPNGSAIALAAGDFAKTASPDGITFLAHGPTSSTASDVVAVANDATLAIDYYHANGAYIASDALSPGTPAAAPITGLAWNPDFSFQMLVTGGTMGAGFGFNWAVGSGYVIGSPISSTSRFGGSAFAITVYHDAPNPTHHELYVVQTDTDQVQGYILSIYDNAGFTQPDVTIKTPAASGLSQPIGIAIAL
jgi:hypothetical protein